MKVLVTGGAGYIGSTIASACADRGITPVVLDDLSKGPERFATRHTFVRGSIADGQVIDAVYAAHPDIAAVVHCAARAVVPDSTRDPLDYYGNNVGGLVEFLGHLLRVGARRLVFSSSASIYLPGDTLDVDEDSAIAPASPYAATKAMGERILADVAAVSNLRVLSLRYFNPIGADPQLRTGPYDTNPTHVVGQLMQAYRHGGPFTVTGTQWPTRDGSAIRDYIHVWDLAEAHVAALLRFDEAVPADEASRAVNLGTGFGTTVWELVRAFEQVTGAPLAVRTGPPRPGDVVGSYTRSDLAAQVLGWSAERSVADAIRDALAWERVEGRANSGSTPMTI
ncbi:MAG: UDP-glucose 4-epimerase GalE [Dermatophilaceae bacterium]